MSNRCFQLNDSQSGFPPKSSLLFAPVITGIILRFITLGTQSLWADEAFSVLLARHSFQHILQQLLTDSSPPLYYFSLKTWIMLLGDSEYAVRSLSAMCSSINLIISFFLAWRLTHDIRVTMAVTTFLALSPTQIYFAMETRSYAMATMFFTLAITGILLENPARNNAFWVICTISASIYTHNYGWLLWACYFIWSIVNHRFKWNRHLLIGFLCLPWVPGLLSQLRHATTAWLLPAKPGFLLQTAFSYAGRFQFMKTPYPYNAVTILSTTCVMLLLGLILAGEFSRNSQRTNLTILGFGVLISAFILSFWKPMYLPGRHDVMMMAPICVLTATSFSRQYSSTSGFRKSALRLVASMCMGIVLLCQLPLLFHYYTSFQKANDREVASTIENMKLPDRSILITTDVTHTSLAYYLDPEKYSIIPFPSCARGYLPMEFLTGQADYIENETKNLLDRIRRNDVTNRVVFANAGTVPAIRGLLDHLRTIWQQETIVPIRSPRPFNSVYELIVFTLPSKTDAPDRTGEPPHP